MRLSDLDHADSLEDLAAEIRTSTLGPSLHYKDTAEFLADMILELRALRTSVDRMERAELGQADEEDQRWFWKRYHEIFFKKGPPPCAPSPSSEP